MVLISLSLIGESIYIFNTKDSSSVEFYDCIYYKNISYCRRPSDLISIYRNNLNGLCYNDGKAHSFKSLWLNNISINTIVHKWNPSIEMVEEYSRYLRDRIDDERYLCQCTNIRSFGKNCEYLLPKYTFKETITWENDMKFYDSLTKELNSDILCYTTLICDFGLLCLDWRDICDGVQQCMLGYDEENCDKLEFNECENDEYRCTNGMCIPNEFFLDGEYDCMDLSDEIKFFDDEKCFLHEVTLICDDRICSSKTWSCGDGQCILDRFAFQKDDDESDTYFSDTCQSQRDQYYMCETNTLSRQWTLSNGKCYQLSATDDALPFIQDRNLLDDCEYFIRCALSLGAERNCPCKDDWSCIDTLENPCNSTTTIQYPKGGITTPYIIHLYKSVRDWSTPTPDFILVNGTIKCRGYMITHFLTIPYDVYESHQNTIEDFVCNSLPKNSITMNTGYDRFCHNDSRTFNNRSYHYIDVCKYSRECISAYRIRDGYRNCADQMDETLDEVIFDTCSQIKRYRFRCSVNESTCFPVTLIGDKTPDCQNNYDEFIMKTQTVLSKVHCNEKLKSDCVLIARYIATSWNIDNAIGRMEVTHTKRIPFSSYCDGIWDLPVHADENILMCQTQWVCHEEQWRCHTGQCIPKDYVLDADWDCSDASDEEGLFASQSALLSHNLKFYSSLILKEKFDKLYSDRPLSTLCDPLKEFPCVRVTAYSDNLTYNQLCISLEKLGDGIIDCLGGLDERNTLDDCNGIAMLGDNYKCLTTNTCIPYADICDIRCPNKSDDDRMCFGKEKALNCSEPTTDFMCLNNQCAKNGWCDGKRDCLHGEDEYLCVSIDSQRQPIFRYGE